MCSPVNSIAEFFKNSSFNKTPPVCTDQSKLFIQSRAPYSIYMKQGIWSRTPGLEHQCCSYWKKDTRLYRAIRNETQLPTPNIGTTRSPASYKILLRLEQVAASSICNMPLGYSRKTLPGFLDLSHYPKKFWSKEGFALEIPS